MHGILARSDSVKGIGADPGFLERVWGIVRGWGPGPGRTSP